MKKINKYKYKYSIVHFKLLVIIFMFCLFKQNIYAEYFVLEGVPAYDQDWFNGDCTGDCTPTAAGMVLGWFDLNGWPAMVHGGSNIFEKNPLGVSDLINDLSKNVGYICDLGTNIEINEVANAIITTAKNMDSQTNFTANPDGWVWFSQLKSYIDQYGPVYFNSSSGLIFYNEDDAWKMKVKHDMTLIGYDENGTYYNIKSDWIVLNMGWGDYMSPALVDFNNAGLNDLYDVGVLPGGVPSADDDDIYEDNDRFEDSKSIYSEDYYGLKCKDDDFYKIYSNVGILTIEILFSHVNGDLNLDLYNMSKIIIKKSESTSDNEKIEYDNLNSGYYYIKVSGSEGVLNNYSMKIDFSTKKTNDYSYSIKNSYSDMGDSYGLAISLKMDVSINNNRIYARISTNDGIFDNGYVYLQGYSYGASSSYNLASGRVYNNSYIVLYSTAMMEDINSWWWVNNELKIYGRYEQSNGSYYSWVGPVIIQRNCNNNILAPNNFVTIGEYCDRVYLRWDAVENADGYDIYRSNVKIGSTSNTYFYDYNASSALTQYKVYSKNSCSKSSSYAIVYAKKKSVPSTVTGLYATYGSYCDKVKIKWNKVDDATSYDIYRDDIMIGNTSDSYFYDYDANLSSTRYKIYAKNSCGVSSYASVYGYKKSLPSRITGLYATNGSYCDKVRIIWNRVDDATNYNIYRDDIMIGNTLNSYFDDYEANSSPTRYKIYAKNLCGVSPYVTVFGYKNAKPEPPKNIQLTSGSFCGSVDITWDTSVFVNEYEIYRDEQKIGNTSTNNYIDNYIYTSSANYKIRALNSCGKSTFISKKYDIMDDSYCNFKLDIDNNGKADALTDGILILRYLFGITEDASLIENAVDEQKGTRVSSTEIKKYLNSGIKALDIDANGKSDALTDGLLIYRYLFKLNEGESLLNNVVDIEGGMRTDVNSIVNYIQQLK